MNREVIHDLQRLFHGVQELDEVRFLDLFSEAGLLAALTQHDLAPVVKSYATGAALRRSRRLPQLTQLDDLLLRGLSEVGDLLDQGVGENLALAIAELQKWACAIDALDADPSAVVYETLGELERHAEHTSLDADAFRSLADWKDRVSIPEESQIAAVATLLEDAELALISGVQAWIQEQAEQSSAENQWQPRTRLAADSAAASHTGETWQLSTWGSLFHDNLGVWTLELLRGAVLATLDDRPMQRADDAGLLWTTTCRSAQRQPTQVRVVCLDASGQTEILEAKRNAPTP